MYIVSGQCNCGALINCKVLFPKDKVSPTFTILKQYQGNYQLSHFDAYRLEGQSEDLGFEEIFDSDDICVVEWPEFLEDILPQERLAMTIKRIDDDHREFILKPIGKKYEELVKEIEYENNCHG